MLENPKTSWNFKYILRNPITNDWQKVRSDSQKIVPPKYLLLWPKLGIKYSESIALNPGNSRSGKFSRLRVGLFETAAAI